jgi:predicted site-specific integrase-resolvase
MDSPETKTTPPVVEPLAFSREETCAALGGISPVTLWRYAKRGLLQPVAGTHGRLYSKKAVLAFLEKAEAA